MAVRNGEKFKHFLDTIPACHGGFRHPRRETGVVDSTDLPRFGGNVFCNLDRLLSQNYHLYNLQRHLSGDLSYFRLRKLNVAEVKVSNQKLFRVFKIALYF